MDRFIPQSPRMQIIALALALVFAFGLLLRLSPLALGADAIAQMFITEDGYLMLTVARNMAIGEGMSVSDGTIATNGIQPLATFLYTLPYILTGGDKTLGIAGVILIMTAISILGIWLIKRFAAETLSPQTDIPVWGWFVGLLWFVSRLPVAHSMNALESGLYLVLVVATVSYFGRTFRHEGSYTRREQLVFGALCGLAFLGRIDGSFLVTALFATRLATVVVTGRLNVREAILEAIPPGLISLAFAAPWLLHNQIRFGSIMPISGPAQSLDATFGGNLLRTPGELFEHMFVMVPIPGGLESNPLVNVVCLLILAGVLSLFYWLQFKNRSPMRYAVVGYGVFGLMLVTYYGAFFGASHFLARYLFPLSPLFITALISVGLFLAGRLGSLRNIALYGGAAGMMVLATGITAYTYIVKKPAQGHFQVVNWVEENVDETTWVGAIQTGTLGYWHDRTINLDGKVNPDALRARMDDGNIFAYVVDSKIDVLADWTIAHWASGENETFNETFEVVVKEDRPPLSVLRRVDEGR